MINRNQHVIAPLVFLFIFFFSAAQAQLEYRNGFFSDKFYNDKVQIKSKEAEKLYRLDPEAYDLYLKAKTNSNLVLISALGAISLDAIYLGKGNSTFLIGGLLFSGITVYFGSQKKRQLSKATSIYNANIKKNKNSFQPNLLLSPNKLGLVASF